MGPIVAEQERPNPTYRKLYDEIKPAAGTWTIPHHAIEPVYCTALILARLALIGHDIQAEYNENRGGAGLVGIDVDFREAENDLAKYCKLLASNYSSWFEAHADVLFPKANALANYKAITEFLDIDFPSRMKALEGSFSSNFRDIALRKFSIEQYRKEIANSPLAEMIKRLEAGQEIHREDRDAEAIEFVEFLKETNKDLATMVKKTMSESVSRIASMKIDKRHEQTRDKIREERKLLVWKMSLASFSGLTLLIPTLIMVLHPGIITALVTTSVFVLVVGVILSTLMTDADPKDVVAATAAYTAVLVVFVGTSGGSTSAAGGTSTDSSNNSSMSNGAIGGVVVVSIVGTFLLMIALFFLWVFIALRIPGVPIPIPGMGKQNPRRNEGKKSRSILKMAQQESQEWEAYRNRVDVAINCLPIAPH
ncbi:hypothetical protein LTR84_006821 [Exophiala bonariae]|uniref:DUF6594 domain-containing protein n=1 Tax=Exophiala bonariae TaxID=1690606 RepID=A0AAV9N3F9_9EURO|nr:hypothetical protein LTR84_006821 [Exophiala bonariae]